jgi:hypothetical protein
MRVANPMPTAGPECKRTRDCSKSQHCNETKHCSAWAQPFNLRDAYWTLRVLSDDWTHEVQEVSSDLGIRMYVSGFNDALVDDLPSAAELLQRAQYFLVVLDEPVADMPKLAADAGVTPREAIQGVAHQARVGVFRLSDDKLILRLRREAKAGAQLLGATPAVDGEVLEALQRQANSCALALEVRQAMGDSGAAAVSPPQ